MSGVGPLTESDQPAYRHIAYETIGPVARIAHNRPEFANAEDTLLLDELDAAMRRAEADPEIRVIILGAKGDHFSAGHDLKEAKATRAHFTVEQRWAYEEVRYFEYALRIWDLSKPTIAEVKGACMAAGFMVANMCDLIVASEDAFFSDPVCHSLSSAAVEVLIHPWVLGLRAAKELLYTGRRMGAEEAKQIGMVNRVVPRAELEAETLALAQQIAQASPFALKLTKRSLNRTLDIQGLRNALSAHFETHQLTHVSEEYLKKRDAGIDKTIGQAKTIA